MANYLVLNAIFVVAICLALRTKLQYKSRAWWIMLALLLIMTAVCDSAIVALGIVAYDPSQILGVYVGWAPIEDFAYAICAAIVVPHIWDFLASRRELLSCVRALFWVSRPISWPNTAYPFAAAYIVSGGTEVMTGILATLYFLIPYNLLMYGVNDVFDYESDIRNPRKGGVEGMREQRAFHPTIIWASIVTNVPFVVYLLWSGSWWQAAALLLLVFFVLGYSMAGLRFKEIPLVDSMVSSVHFVGPMVYGIMLAEPLSREAVPYIVAFFLWGMASHALGAIQDIAPDRDAGLASIATFLGARRTIWLVLVLYAASSGLLIAQGGETAVIGVVSLAYIVNVAPYARITDATSARAHIAWRRFLWLNYVMGFIVSQVLLIHYVW